MCVDVEVCVMCVGGVLAWILAGCIHKVDIWLLFKVRCTLVSVPDPTNPSTDHF